MLLHAFGAHAGAGAVLAAAAAAGDAGPGGRRLADVALLSATSMRAMLAADPPPGIGSTPRSIST